jgi:hypothetical protein
MVLTLYKTVEFCNDFFCYIHVCRIDDFLWSLTWDIFWRPFFSQTKVFRLVKSYVCFPFPPCFHFSVIFSWSLYPTITLKQDTVPSSFLAHYHFTLQAVCRNQFNFLPRLSWNEEKFVERRRSIRRCHRWLYKKFRLGLVREHDFHGCTHQTKILNFFVTFTCT